MSASRTYRDSTTGEVRDYPVLLAAQFPQLVEVEPDAKPLAYTPIPQSEIDDYLASRDSDEDEDEPTDPEEDED